jgi:hypothetical protein
MGGDEDFGGNNQLALQIPGIVSKGVSFYK